MVLCSCCCSCVRCWSSSGVNGRNQRSYTPCFGCTHFIVPSSKSRRIQPAQSCIQELKLTVPKCHFWSGVLILNCIMMTARGKMNARSTLAFMYSGTYGMYAGMTLYARVCFFFLLLLLVLILAYGRVGRLCRRFMWYHKPEAPANGGASQSVHWWIFGVFFLFFLRP